MLKMRIRNKDLLSFCFGIQHSESKDVFISLSVQ